MIPRGAVRCRQDTAQGAPKLRCGYSFVCPSLPSTPEHDKGSAVHFTSAEYSARTEKVTLQWSVARSVARRRKPQGKGGEGRPDDLPVADRQARTHCAQAQGRMATRPTRVKSGKKQVFPMGEHAQHRIIHLQGMPCSRKS
jgi:hypothetical protein